MKNIKQVIVIRKDLKLRKNQIVSYATQAAIKFLTENNESNRGDELYVKLSNEETEWINSSLTQTILGVNSQNTLRDLIFHAELLNINVYSVFMPEPSKSIENESMKNESIESESIIICAAFGPDDEDIINQLIGNLKPI